MNFLHLLFGPDSQPIRRDAVFQQRLDEHGTPTAEAIEATAVTLSPDGSIDHARLVGFFHCGHVATDGIGGKCTEPACQNTSCKACYSASRCSICFKGLCLEHKHETENEVVARVVCASCKEQIRRQRRTRALARLVLSPFVEFKKRKK